MEFSVPSDWTVRFREPGHDPLTVRAGESPPGDEELRDGAVLTALPVLEDAALVVLVTESSIQAENLAQKVEDFVPLEEVKFTKKSEPYAANGITGFAGEGRGHLRGEGVDVYFRTLVLEAAGRAILITLYAELSQQRRYEIIFDRILGSLKLTGEPSLEPAADAGGALLDASPPEPDVGPGPRAPDLDAALPDAPQPDAGGEAPDAAVAPSPGSAPPVEPGSAASPSLERDEPEDDEGPSGEGPPDAGALIP